MSDAAERDAASPRNDVGAEAIWREPLDRLLARLEHDRIKSNHFPVFASTAKQSTSTRHDGLLRRYAPRKDE